MEHNTDLVDIFHAKDLVECQMITGILDNAGIKTHVNKLGLPWLGEGQTIPGFFNSGNTATTGYAEIFVKKEDAPKATEIINEYLQGIECRDC